MNLDEAHHIPQPRIIPWEAGRSEHELLLSREWLVTNGLGGYASGTVSGAIT
ncbi:MAG: glycogen debranching enzyme N-terminal domain-containing protein, partial [Bryobacteraceae bacterium]